MSSSGQATHSLAFRVMRLCRPTLHVQTPLLFDPCDLLFGEDLFDHPSAASHLPRLLSELTSDPSSDLTYRSRFLLSHPSDSLGLPALLVLPQSFGAIFLGETFCSYISINNSSNFEARDIIIKAEIQTEKQRILLLDTTKSPVEAIRAGGRYDFIVEHDVKELGAHTLVCTALYNDGDGERKYLPQFFKFIVANPLSVRTKVRVVKDATFLEACIENHTKTNLYMDQVEFEATQQWTATLLRADDHCSENGPLTRELFKPPILIRSGGGIHNYLYQLKSSVQGYPQVKVDGSNVLGKLQITWRTNLGEPGRLQTQQILGSPVAQRDIEVQIIEYPSVVFLEEPFLINPFVLGSVVHFLHSGLNRMQILLEPHLRLNLRNQTDRILGPFQVWLSQSDSLDEKAVMVNGLRMMPLAQLDALSSSEFQLNLIPTKCGIQKISGITVFDTHEKKTYDSLVELEIFVDSE